MKPNALFAVVLLTYSSLMSSCAFKSNSSQEAAKEALPVISAQIAWWDDASKKSPTLARALTWNADQRLARSELPVTLPVSAPDRVEMDLTFPTRLAAFDPARVLVTIVGTSGKAGSLTPKQVLLGNQTAETTNVVLELEGVRAILSGLAEAALELRVLVQTPAGETPLTAALALRSPPSSVEILQKRLADTTLDPIKNMDALRVIQVDDQAYFLLQVVRIHNHSTAPLEVIVPPTARTALKIQRNSYLAKAEGRCGFSAFMEKKDLSLPGEVKILPITEDLPKRFARHLSALTLGKMTVASDQGGPVGIYVSGPVAQAIAENRFEKRKPERIKLPDRCEARCSHKRMGPNEFPLCWSASAVLHHVPQWKVQSCMDCHNGNQAGCEICSAWENGAGPNYRQAGPNCLFCGELAEDGHFGDLTRWKAIPEWSDEVIFVDNVLSGEEDGALSLDSDPASALLTLRFADGSESDDPVTRQVPFLSAKVKQDEN
jgi:predicted nucleic-acid-binding Zn-ribbon protein